MASTLVTDSLCSVSPRCLRNQTLSLTQSRFLSKSGLRLKERCLVSRRMRTRKLHSTPFVFALQSNFSKVVQTVWKVGKDGIDAGTDLVPNSIPRPVARISVTAAILAVSLFVLKSFLSTAFFALATMGLIYFLFIALNKDQGPKRDGGGGGPDSMEDPLEEARKIMEKYK